MSRYDFDTEGLLSLIPTPLRKPGVTHLLRRLLTPAAFAHSAFAAFRAAKEYRLSHNGQVWSLTQVVRDFCNDQRCGITDGEYIDEAMLPYDAIGELANHQLPFPYDGSGVPQVPVPYEGFAQLLQSDFIVHLPQSLYGRIDEAGLRALVDEYKLAGKFYRIAYDGVTPQRFSFAWSGLVCVREDVQADAHNFLWSGPVCVQVASGGVYNLAWSGPVCVQEVVSEGAYGFAWDTPVCVRELVSDGAYGFAWDTPVCVREDIPKETYKFGWDTPVCVREDIPKETYKFSWDTPVCLQVNIKTN